ncbi:MAG: Ni/Fe hydrogenase subunit alpha, partial [Gammaproteobacteria bacterium]|nr:Ni/Fe hydrogenase subunit alpha [Gammaproteobacteria bacterium]
MSKERRIALKVPVLARVEGEGALDLLINEQQSRPYIESLALRIYEPPRYFEKLLEGRTVEELPEMVARICGICPVAYQMSALQAVESLFEVELSPWVRQMRRLFYCGEWIQSHSLHIHLLAAPDFLGYEHAIAMAEAYPDEVRRGLSLQGLGNKIIALLGGRSVHPVGARIGGFHHAPPPDEVATLLAEVNGAVVHAEALLRWLVMLERPVEEQSFTSVALREASSDYPMMGGEIISDRGLQLPVEQFESRFEELQRPHSTAFHAQLDGEPYLVGPLARMNLNFDRLLPPVSDLCATLGIHFPSRNMFDSLVARGVELLQALHEAALLLQQYQQPERPWV